MSLIARAVEAQERCRRAGERVMQLERSGALGDEVAVARAEHALASRQFLAIAQEVARSDEVSGAVSRPEDHAPPGLARILLDDGCALVEIAVPPGETVEYRLPQFRTEPPVTRVGDYVYAGPIAPTAIRAHPCPVCCATAWSDLHDPPGLRCACGFRVATREIYGARTLPDALLQACARELAKRHREERASGPTDNTTTQRLAPSEPPLPRAKSALEEIARTLPTAAEIAMRRTAPLPEDPALAALRQSREEASARCADLVEDIRGKAADGRKMLGQARRTLERFEPSVEEPEAPTPSLAARLAAAVLPILACLVMGAALMVGSEGIRMAIRHREAAEVTTSASATPIRLATADEPALRVSVLWKCPRCGEYQDRLSIVPTCRNCVIPR